MNRKSFLTNILAFFSSIPILLTAKHTKSSEPIKEDWLIRYKNEMARKEEIKTRKKHEKLIYMTVSICCSDGALHKSYKPSCYVITGDTSEEVIERLDQSAALILAKMELGEDFYERSKEIRKNVGLFV